MVTTLFLWLVTAWFWLFTLGLLALVATFVAFVGCVLWAAGLAWWGKRKTGRAV